MKKVTGLLTVKKKSNKESDYTIRTDLEQLKKINVFDKEIFDQISKGDELYIEFTKHSKFLLKLEKNGRDILEKDGNHLLYGS